MIAKPIRLDESLSSLAEITFKEGLVHMVSENGIAIAMLQKDWDALPLEYRPKIGDIVRCVVAIYRTGESGK